MSKYWHLFGEKVMLWKKFDLFIVVTILLLVISSGAEEKRMRKSELPPAVQKAVEEQIKGATVRGYSTEVENGQREFEIETVVNGHSRDITFSADGSLLEVEEQVEMNGLPSAVREGLQAKAGSGKITKIESLTKQGKVVAYEAKVLKAGKHSEVQVGPDGKPLEHPE
jgi:uncharacterized membrane protein YkoI